MKISSSKFRHNNLIVDIDIISICNYHCFYCYNTDKYKNNLKLLSLKEYTYLLNCFKESPYNISLTMLGGEPSLHPNLHLFIDKTLKLKNIKDIRIITNASHYLDFTMYNPKKVRTTFSYHTVQNPDNNIFIDNVIRNKDYIDDVSIPLLKRNKDKVIKITKILNSLEVKVEPIFTYDFKNHKYICTEEYIPYETDYIVDNKLSTYNDICKMNINYKGCKCLMQRINIDIDGRISLNCLPYIDNVFNNRNFFKDYLMEYKTCSYEHCISDCDIATPKIFNER